MHALETALVNTVVASAITAFGDRGFLVNFIYSQCIGMSIWALIDLGRLWVIRDEKRHAKRLVWWAPVGAVVGYLIGTFLGDTLFGERQMFVLFQSSDGARKTTGYLLMSVTLAAAASYFYLSREQLRSARDQAEKTQRQATETQLRMLQTQLEPHMLFNTLANLRALVSTDPARAEVMLDRMIGFLRSTLDASRQSEHSLADEFARLEDYLELMSIRMGARLSYSLNLPEDLSNELVPTLLLQPLVENSIRHGLEAKVDGGSVNVEALREGDALLIRVSDTGVGFAANAREGTVDESARKGFGIAQLTERLATSYSNAASATVRSAPNAGTTVEIRIPLER